MFDISRPDGRTDKQILYELAHDKPRGTSFSFDSLIAALQPGLPQPVEKRRVYLAVAAANKLLLEDSQRCLRSVKGKGYRLAKADEHVELSLARRERGQRQFKKGLLIIKGTDLSELTPQQRSLHQGTMMMMGALVFAVDGLSRRQSKTEDLIASLSQRVAILEDQK